MPSLTALITLSLPLLASATPLSSTASTSSSSLPEVKATTQSCQVYGNLVLNCFEGPSQSYTAAATVRGGQFYPCSCSKVGQAIDGNVNWDFFPDANLPGGGCYVNQYYSTDPCGNSTLPAC